MVIEEWKDVVWEGGGGFVRGFREEKFDRFGRGIFVDIDEDNI